MSEPIHPSNYEMILPISWRMENPSIYIYIFLQMKSEVILCPLVREGQENSVVWNHISVAVCLLIKQ
jgi:hypothetical protein